MQRTLNELIDRKLVKVHKNAGTKRQNTYTVTLDQMWEWETAKAFRAHHQKKQNQERALLTRVRREVARVAASHDATAELVAYAEAAGKEKP